ncbi:MAG: flippase-like domain-containing protein [Candidatus Aenigmarchaeota archaeon]|nr:flippase-like domain-containing protein [Candidatus Aenigmarchaeota archaeon]
MFPLTKLKAIPFAVSILLIIVIIYFSNPYQIYDAVIKINKLYIAAALGIAVLNISLRVLKWKVILDGVGYFELFPIQTFGMTLSSLTPGKIAEPVKSVILRIKKGIPVSVSLPTVIWERINDIVSTIILAFVAMQAISIKSDLLFLSIFSMSAFSVLIILLVFAMHSMSFGKRVFSVIKKLPGTGGISESFIENFYSIKTKKRKVLKSFLVTFLAWVLEGLIFHIVLLSMGIEINFILLAGIVSLAVIIGIVSSLPGGIGSSEFVMIFLLGLNGVGGAAAVTSVFIYRIIAFWFAALVGGLSFVYLSRKIDMKEFKLF